MNEKKRFEGRWHSRMERKRVEGGIARGCGTENGEKRKWR